WYLDEMDNQSGSKVEVADFKDNSDISLVSDPNIFSETQRLTQAQAVLQLANGNPQMYNVREANLRILKLMKVPDIQSILPDPKGANESNPALENVQMTMGSPAAAFPDQEHVEHIKVHLAYMLDPSYGGSPLIGASILPLMMEHIKQHLTLNYLQSMRGYVSQAAGGEDAFKLHEERKLDKEQALAMAAQLVAQDSQQDFQAINPIIQKLAQQMQQAKQAQMQQAALAADPAAGVIMQTQQAETQRKMKEAEAKFQLEREKLQLQMQDKVRDMEAKMAEVLAKLGLDRELQNADNAVKIALADINNASKERVASIAANAQLDNLQLTQQHQQNQTALEAEAQAHADLRKHGLEEVRRDQEQSHQRALAAQQQLVDMQNQSSQQQHQAELAQMQPKQPSPTGE
ncbi:MAG: hypothetical protein EBR51_12395, partial [Gammaproteobacteria bacterium]|nr:hypothetical protein [Gammaproteobacteria bacterium]